MNTRLRLVGGVCLLLATASGALGQQAPAPRLVLSQDSWDFGEVWHQERPVMTLVLRNEGDAELVLQEVKSTCSCTVVQPARMRIPPGESTDLEVVFITQGKQGKTGSKVIIRSNDPVQPEVKFKITGFVKRAVIETPRVLQIRSLDGSPGQTGSARFENQMPEPMDLRIIKNTCQALDLELKEITPGRVYDLIGRTNRPLKIGKITGKVTLATGLEREPQIQHAIVVRILSRVEPQPPMVYLRKELTEPTTRTVTFQYYGDSDDFRVTQALCADESVRVAIKPARPPWGAVAKLSPAPKFLVTAKMTLPAAKLIPDDGLIVVFETNDPLVPRVEIPVTTDLKVFKTKYGR